MGNDGGNALRTALARLSASDPRDREHAADEVGDHLRRPGGDGADVEAAVARLVALTVAETDERVREAALNACADAASHHMLPLALFEPLTPILPTLSGELTGYVVQILGLTGDPDARSIITAYLDHPDAAVRREAVDAMAELAGRSPG